MKLPKMRSDRRKISKIFFILLNFKGKLLKKTDEKVDFFTKNLFRRLEPTKKSQKHFQKHF